MRTTDLHDFSGGQKVVIAFLEGLGLVVEGEKPIGKRQVDVYLPEIQTVVEFDGPHMNHSVKATEKRDKELLDRGIVLQIVHVKGTSKEELEQLRRDLTDYAGEKA